MPGWSRNPVTASLIPPLRRIGPPARINVASKSIQAPAVASDVSFGSRAAVAVGVHLHRTVAADEEVGEEDRHLWHEHSAAQVPGSDRQCGHQVLAAIRTQLGDRALRTRQHIGMSMPSSRKLRADAV